MSDTAWQEFTLQARRVSMWVAPVLAMCISVSIFMGPMAGLNLSCVAINAFTTQWNLRNIRYWTERNRTSPYTEAADWWWVVAGYGLVFFSAIVGIWNLGLFISKF